MEWYLDAMPRSLQAFSLKICLLSQDSMFVFVRIPQAPNHHITATLLLQRKIVALADFRRDTLALQWNVVRMYIDNHALGVDVKRN
jgi:hypothetical protein